MGTISVSLPSDGQTIDAADVNVPINTIVAAINGNLDTNNISPTAGITSAQLNFGGAGAGLWWQEIARTTLSSAGTTITVSSIPARKHLYLRVTIINGGSSPSPAMTFNNDTATNYSLRISDNGGADGTFASQSSITLFGAVDGVAISSVEIVNIAANEKPTIVRTTNTGGAGAAALTGRRESQSKWANTAAQITRIDITGASNFAIGSEVVVLGHD